MNWPTAFVVCFLATCVTLCFIGYHANAGKTNTSKTESGDDVND